MYYAKPCIHGGKYNGCILVVELLFMEMKFKEISVKREQVVEVKVGTITLVKHYNTWSIEVNIDISYLKHDSTSRAV